MYTAVKQRSQQTQDDRHITLLSLITTSECHARQKIKPLKHEMRHWVALILRIRIHWQIHARYWS